MGQNGHSRLYDGKVAFDVKLDYHLNASLSTVNVAQLLLATDESLYNSMNALVRRLTTHRIWEMIYYQLYL